MERVFLDYPKVLQSYRCYIATIIMFRCTEKMEYSKLVFLETVSSPLNCISQEKCFLLNGSKALSYSSGDGEKKRDMQR